MYMKAPMVPQNSTEKKRVEAKKQKKKKNWQTTHFRRFSKRVKEC